MKTSPHQPKVEKVSVPKLKCLEWLERGLTGLLIITGFHVLGFYIWSIFHPEMTEPLSVKYAIYITIGSFFYLFVHKKAIDERWGPKDIELYKSKDKRSKKNK